MNENSRQQLEAKQLTSANFPPQFIVADETEQLQSLLVSI